MAAEPDVTATPGKRGPGSGDYLLCIDGDRSWTVPIPTARELTIGRDPQCGLVLADALASRSHAQLLVVPDGLRLTDLGSRHGTVVNGEKITAPRIVTSGDVIAIGAAHVIVRSRAVAAGRHVVDRHALTRRLTEELARAQQYQRELGLIAIRVPDVDATRVVAAIADA